MGAKYPNRRMPRRLGRRDFFGMVAHELSVLGGVARGEAAFSLAQIAELPDDQIAAIVPVFNPAFELYVEDGALWSRERQTGRAARSLAIDRATAATLASFDGRRSLRAVARTVAAELGWDQPRAFAHARAVFVALVQHLACVPANPLGPR